MLHKTRGIVLKTTLFSESSVVVKIFTEKFGIQSYLINGVKKPKAKISMNILQPLHLLDMVVYHKSTTQIQRVSEARPSPVFRTIPYHVIKNMIVQFLNEVLYKSVHQQNTDEALFDFVYSAISWFDQAGLTEMVKRQIAGHASGDTHQIYHNLSSDVLEDAREKLNEFRAKINTSLEKQTALAA